VKLFDNHRSAASATTASCAPPVNPTSSTRTSPSSACRTPPTDGAAHGGGDVRRRARGAGDVSSASGARLSLVATLARRRSRPKRPGAPIEIIDDLGAHIYAEDDRRCSSATATSWPASCCARDVAASRTPARGIRCGFGLVRRHRAPHDKLVRSSTCRWGARRKWRAEHPERWQLCRPGERHQPARRGVLSARAATVRLGADELDFCLTLGEATR
jgi:hypothetical protein